jgi:mRNA-degrading endonuclease RelE of RelBE toxin-antitoxin system
MKFEELPEYKKELKALLKRYRTLTDDMMVVKQVLEVFPDERPPFSFRIDNLGIETCVIKVKKIACKALKGRGVNSGMRLVYAWFREERRILFIELYHKSDKENEDRQRILDNFGSGSDRSTLTNK